MKRVYSSYNLAAAHHARNLLDAEGVRAVVKNEFLSSVMGDLPPAECQVEVWILNPHDFERAEKILFENRTAGEGWTCHECGEPCEPQFTQCWRCGDYRTA